MSKTTKYCNFCNIEKSTLEFTKRKQSNDGLNFECIDCHKIRAINYLHTKKGIVTRVYATQKRTSKLRKHTPPTYTKKELQEWLFSQEKFHLLFDNWKRLDFQKDYIPSVDRKDDYLGYTISNIQLMTWKQNNRKAHSDRRNGINNKDSIKVVQKTMCGEVVGYYYSAKDAERKTGIFNTNISRCCLGKSIHTGGFKWEQIKNKDTFK